MNITQNRRARHDYEITDTYEAGIQLQGDEAKAMRSRGGHSLTSAYITVENGQAWLVGMQVSVPSPGPWYQPTGRHRLLLHRHQIDRIGRDISQKGMTAIPLSIYYKENKFVKVEVGVGRGRRRHDKRQKLREQAHRRERT